MSGGGGSTGGGGRDVLGEAQEHLRVYAKAVADSIWEVQQMRRPDMERIDALALQLSRLADALDGPGGLIDALPDFPTDMAAVQAELVRLRGQMDEQVPQLEQVLADTAREREALQAGIASATALLFRPGQRAGDGKAGAAAGDGGSAAMELG